MKSKKQEKHEKRKKNKKDKKKKKKASSSSDSDSESEESEWIEASTSSVGKKQQEQREEWMQDESFVPTYSKDESRTKRRKKERDEEAILRNKKLLEERELNPYLRKSVPVVPADSAQGKSSTSCASSQGVGDGGYSWLKRAYQRVKEQAEEEGRTMEEVAAERWGSLQQLELKLKEAESKARESGLSSSEKPSLSGARSRESYKKDFQRNNSKYDQNKSNDSGKEQQYHRSVNEQYKQRESHYASDRKESSRSDRYAREYDGSSREKEQQHEKRTHEWSKSSHRSTGYLRHDRADTYGHESAGRKAFLDPRESSNENDSRSYLQHKSSHRPAWKKPSAAKETDLEHKFHAENTSEVEQPAACQRRSEDLSKKAVRKEVVTELSAGSESTSSTSDGEKHKPAEEPVMNRNELNYLAARALRARIWKDFDLASKIDKDFEAAKKRRQEFEQSGEEIYDGEPREDVLRLKIDSYSLPKAIRSQGQSKETGDGQTIYVGPLKTKHFDDRSMSLQHIFEREKQTTVDDQLMMYIDAASTRKGALDEECDEDVSGKTAERMNKYPKQEKDAQKAIQDYKRLSIALDKCRLCLDMPGLLKHTIIGKGDEVFLCSPTYKSLVEGHCLIVPVTHVSSTLLLDENEYAEVQAFKRGLMKIFGDQGKCMIFLETSIKHRLFPHANIECIPMPKETGELAPLYFKKAIEESEYEWSHNKKLIDISKKGARHSIPKGLPFFIVEFGNSGGFAHIIEDDRNFPTYFGKEIIGGMLEIDSHDIIREKEESAQEICAKVVKFANIWWKYKDYFKTF